MDHGAAFDDAEHDVDVEFVFDGAVFAQVGDVVGDLVEGLVELLLDGLRVEVDLAEAVEGLREGLVRLVLLGVELQFVFVEVALLFLEFLQFQAVLRLFVRLFFGFLVGVFGQEGFDFVFSLEMVFQVVEI